MLIEGARASYRQLVARDKRLVAADFSTDDEQFLMVFARAERAEQLRTLVEQGTVEIDDRAGPQSGTISDPTEIEERDRDGIQMAARSALRLMRKQGKQIFLIDFAEEKEPMLTVYARGKLAKSLDDSMARVGFLYRA